MLPNVVYRVPTLGNDSSALDFDEDLTSLGLNSFDYIRMAHLNGAVVDERGLLRKVFECVLQKVSRKCCQRELTIFSLAVPDTGHIEITFVDWVRERTIIFPTLKTMLTRRVVCLTPP
jgi:hypothetical protein